MPEKIEPITSTPAVDPRARVAVVSSALEVLGVVLVVGGVFALSLWAGVVLLGLLLVAGGYYLGGAE